MRHTVATLAKPLDQQACLHDQLAHLGEQARQHLALCLFALGKQVVFFDRPEDRLHLRECRIDPQHRTGFELRQGATTALGQAPQDPRFVGIPNGQLLRRGIRRQDADIGKATILGHMQHQRVDLLYPVFAQGRIGPSDVGVVPNLRAGIVLAADEHPRHDIFGHDTLPCRVRGGSSPASTPPRAHTTRHPRVSQGGHRCFCPPVASGAS